MSIFNELKRRNVFRVGAAYLVVAWLITQVVDTLGDLFALSDAFGRGVVILLAVGFPIALVVSWIYEVTPEGITTQAVVDAGAKTTSGKKLNAVIIGGLVLVILLLVVDNYVLDSEPAAPAQASTDAASQDATFQGEITQTAYPDDKTIAVLPFDNLSSDPEQEYFADGLSEELINRLSQIRDLQVTGRNSSFYYKDRDDELRDIGETLGVAHILQGSVRKSGDQIRVSVQLLDAREGFNLWSSTFDRQLSDIFEIQDEIAEAVSTALSITLGAGEFNRPGMTMDVRAYDEYLQGMVLYHQFRLETSLQIAQHFENAIALDPDFALAYSALVNLILFNPLGNELRSEQYQERGRQAMERLNELAPDLLETRIINAALFAQRGDWLSQDESLRPLLEEYGNSSSIVNNNYGELLRHTGRATDSLRYFRKAQLLEPLQQNPGLAITLAVMQRNDEAEAEFAPLISSAILGGALGAEVSLFRVGEGNLEGAREAVGLMQQNHVIELPMIDFLEAGD